MITGPAPGIAAPAEEEPFTATSWLAMYRISASSCRNVAAIRPSSSRRLLHFASSRTFQTSVASNSSCASFSFCVVMLIEASVAVTCATRSWTRVWRRLNCAFASRNCPGHLSSGEAWRLMKRVMTSSSSALETFPLFCSKAAAPLMRCRVPLPARAQAAAQALARAMRPVRVAAAAAAAVASPPERRPAACRKLSACGPEVAALAPPLTATAQEPGRALTAKTRGRISSDSCSFCCSPRDLIGC
mmetsp:Transcript_57371/g.129668  ORF Transcript_57371/g.129668 Transcript_57371/m.129668 type:complete len:245 (+) Transcript_57371:159-893(+)